MHRIPILLLLVAAWLSLATAASAPVFCKCTCFTTSHIIPLGPGHDTSNAKKPTSPTSSIPSSDPPASAPDANPGTSDSNSESASRRHRRQTSPTTPRAARDAPFAAQAALQRRAPAGCGAQCNRKFCYEQRLTGCAEAELEDFVALCFQRDSRKDQIIVWGFILGTAGLLGWAAVRKVLEAREGQLGFGAGLGSGSAGQLGGGGGGGRFAGLGRRGSGRREEDRRGSYLPVGEQRQDGDGTGAASGRPG